ncbi:MAG TPA: serine/threonine-protein kinase [Polyangiaceae bacterium]|nr:serine/threonine-protein kinase [Polyangiaceae bacterium]
MGDGSVGGGRYQLVERLGGGQISETWLAAHVHHGAVIIKRLSLRHADEWKRVELAEREVQVLQRLNHELLPRYLDHFEEAGALYTVMTRVPGEDLGLQRRRGRVFSELQVTSLLRDAASALGYLHTQRPSLVHRDLKPSNILLGPDGRFRIVDLGAVGEIGREATSTVVGTFGYMAPEQFQGRASPASDVYSLGATALTLLSRTEPEQLPHVGLQIDVRRALGETVSLSLVLALEAMLRLDPESRPHLDALVAGLEQARHAALARAAAPRAPSSPDRSLIASAVGSAPWRTIEAWPAWKKALGAAASTLVLGALLTETNAIGTLPLVALPLIYLLGSARRASSMARARRAVLHTGAKRTSAPDP